MSQQHMQTKETKQYETEIGQKNQDIMKNQELIHTEKLAQENMSPRTSMQKINEGTPLILKNKCQRMDKSNCDQLQAPSIHKDRKTNKNQSKVHYSSKNKQKITQSIHKNSFTKRGKSPHYKSPIKIQHKLNVSVFKNSQSRPKKVQSSKKQILPHNPKLSRKKTPMKQVTPSKDSQIGERVLSFKQYIESNRLAKEIYSKNKNKYEKAKAEKQQQQLIKRREIYNNEDNDNLLSYVNILTFPQFSIEKQQQQEYQGQKKEQMILKGNSTYILRQCSKSGDNMMRQVKNITINHKYMENNTVQRLRNKKSKIISENNAFVKVMNDKYGNIEEMMDVKDIQNFIGVIEVLGYLCITHHKTMKQQHHQQTKTSVMADESRQSQKNRIFLKICKVAIEHLHENKLEVELGITIQQIEKIHGQLEHKMEETSEGEYGDQYMTILTNLKQDENVRVLIINSQQSSKYLNIDLSGQK